MTIEITPAAANGIGMPTKKRELPPCGFLIASTLKRANLNAPQAAKAKAASWPTKPRPCSAQRYTRMPGATPNEMTSASESSSWPNMLCVLVSRATRPSKPSKKMPKKIERAA